MVWFRLNIGRERNADPRWLLPLVCRAGDLSKSEIGAIKIFDRDTRFQIVAEFADQFAEAVRTNGSKEGHIARVGAHASASSPETKTAHAAPVSDGAAGNAPASHTPTRANQPWRERGKSKAAARPHRKGTGYQPRAAQEAARHAGSDGARSPSKYAHKKNRVRQTAKT